MRYFWILFSCVLFSGLSARAQATDSLFLKAAIVKLKNAKEYTFKVARLMPAEKYAFKPTPEEMSFGEQLLHLGTNLGWLSSSYLSEGTNPVSRQDAKLQDKEEILKVLERVYDYALQTLEHFEAAHLGDEVKFFAGPKTKLQIINLVNDHQTHHRAQLLVYLRLNGIKPPAYVGW